MVFQGIHINAVVNLGDETIDRLGCQLKQVLFAGAEGDVRHPDDSRIEAIALQGLIIRVNQNVTATDVDFFLQRDGDGLRREGHIQFAVLGDDGLDPAGLARGQGHDRIALF